MDPKIYLGIDNCFASKRWVRPAEWIRVIGELGLKYVEASADTECDPLYMDPEFTRDWIADVKAYLEVKSYKSEKKKLDMLEKQLTALLSDDKQTELQIDSLAAMLE